VSKNRYFLIALIAFAACGVACGGDKADIAALATRAADATPSPGLELRASGLKFDKDTLVVPAGRPVTIVLDNQDGGTVHNLAVYTGEDARENLFRGDLFEGRAARDYTFQSPPAGVYYFRCDAHPDMDGVFIAR
jgi:plastocyanin